MTEILVPCNVQVLHCFQIEVIQNSGAKGQYPTKEEIIQLHGSAVCLISLCWARKMQLEFISALKKKISVAHLLMKKVQRHDGHQNVGLYLPPVLRLEQRS